MTFQFSDSTKNIVRALHGFRSECPGIEKTATASIPTKKGGKYSFSYAPLEQILATITPLLTKYDLTVTQWPDGEGMTTMLAHGSGEYMLAYAELPERSNDAKKIGASYTYLRRYAISAIFSLSTEDDDDVVRHERSASPQQPKRRLTKRARRKVPSNGINPATRIMTSAKQHGWKSDQVLYEVDMRFGTQNLNDLSKQQVNEVLEMIKTVESEP